MFLKAFVDHGDGTRTEPADNTLINGEIIGKFIEGNLFIVVYDETGHQFKEIEINKAGIVAIRVFNVPDGIKIGSTPAFFDDRSIFNSFLGWKDIKVYRSQEDYYLTSDATGPTIFASLSDPSMKVFALGGQSYYSSGNIFRLQAGGRSWILEVMDVATETIIQRLELNKDNIPPGYFRHQWSISAMSRLKPKQMLGNSSIAVYNQEEKNIILLGSHIIERPPVVLVQGVGNVVAWASIALTGARAASTVNESDYYFYCSFDMSTKSLTTVHPKDVTIARNRIDLWEVENFAKFGIPDARAYSESNGRAVGLYYWASERLVRTVAFDR